MNSIKRSILRWLPWLHIFLAGVTRVELDPSPSLVITRTAIPGTGGADLAMEDDGVRGLDREEEPL